MRKRLLAWLVSAAMLIVVIPSFAEEFAASEKKDYFSIMEDYNASGVSFSMISDDGELVIHISEDTPVFFEDETAVRDSLEEGQTLAEVLNNRMLIVTYRIATMSIPAQTPPEKIEVLFEQIQPFPIDEVTPDEVPLNGEIVVEGEIIDAPAPYYFVNDDDEAVLMLPLRAIAEKLGFDVSWNEEEQGIRLGVAISLWIGKHECHYARMVPIKLSVAPEIIDDLTYVPLNFFSDVARYNAYTLDGQIVIEKRAAMVAE